MSARGSFPSLQLSFSAFLLFAEMRLIADIFLRSFVWPESDVLMIIV